MKIRFWGVRGSIPAPGPETNRYGGNTSCVSITTADDRLVIIDMGTGLMHLGNALMAREFGKGKGRAAILLSHTHWDHIQGLGFFPPVFIGGNQFTVWGPGGSPEVLEEILEGQMDPNFSPLQSLKNFSAKFDPVPSMLVQDHRAVINDFFGVTTSFNKTVLKPGVTVLANEEGAPWVKYILGDYGKGTWTYYGGHDPEDPQHAIGNPPTDLSLFKNSPGYRLILNNVLFPAAKKKPLKT